MNIRSDARVTPYAGVTHDEVLKHIRDTHAGVVNIRGPKIPWDAGFVPQPRALRF